MQARETIRIQQWNKTLWNQQKNPKKLFSFGDYVLWFPKGNKSHLGKLTRKWFESYRVQYVLPNNTMLLVTIEKFETNLVLVNVNKLKPYKYMESEVQKQEQQMPIYWEKSVGGVQVENFDTEEEDENYEIQKPQLQSIEDEKQMEDPMVNTILIFDLQMTDKSISNNYRSEDLGCRDLKMIYQGYPLNQQKYLPSHQGYSHNHQICWHNQQKNWYSQLVDVLSQSINELTQLVEGVQGERGGVSTTNVGRLGMWSD